MRPQSQTVCQVLAVTQYHDSSLELGEPSPYVRDGLASFHEFVSASLRDERGRDGDDRNGYVDAHPRATSPSDRDTSRSLSQLMSPAWGRSSRRLGLERQL